jgi:hypothetical protein
MPIPSGSVTEAISCPPADKATHTHKPTSQPYHPILILPKIEISATLPQFNTTHLPIRQGNIAEWHISDGVKEITVPLIILSTAT